MEQMKKDNRTLNNPSHLMQRKQPLGIKERLETVSDRSYAGKPLLETAF